MPAVSKSWIPVSTHLSERLRPHLLSTLREQFRVSHAHRGRGMTTVGTPGEIVSFIWSVADLLRGDFKAHEFGPIILPFTVLRRLECALAPTKAQVVARAESLASKVENVDPILQRTAGQRFYNTSPLDLTKVLADPGNAAKNLSTYVAKFSPGAVEVLERYGFPDKITRLDKAGLLYQIVAKFADLDLTQDAVSNESMGHVFEELLRKFSEMSNETAGEHFTPREVIELMVNLLFAEDDECLPARNPCAPCTTRPAAPAACSRGPEPPSPDRARRRPQGVRTGTQPGDVGDLPIRSD